MIGGIIAITLGPFKILLLQIALFFFAITTMMLSGVTIAQTRQLKIILFTLGRLIPLTNHITGFVLHL